MQYFCSLEITGFFSLHYLSLTNSSRKNAVFLCSNYQHFPFSVLGDRTWDWCLYSRWVSLWVANLFLTKKLTLMNYCNLWSQLPLGVNQLLIKDVHRDFRPRASKHKSTSNENEEWYSTTHKCNIRSLWCIYWYT